MALSVPVYSPGCVGISYAGYSVCLLPSDPLGVYGDSVTDPCGPPPTIGAWSLDDQASFFSYQEALSISFVFDPTFHLLFLFYKMFLKHKLQSMYEGRH